MAKDQSWIADILEGYRQVNVAGVDIGLKHRNILNLIGATVVDNPDTVDLASGLQVGSTDVTISGELVPQYVVQLASYPAPSSRAVIIVDGYNAAGDGGGGTFIWRASDTRTDDGGTILQVSGVTTGRWNRVYSGALDVRWFGADQTGTSDSAGAFTATVAAKDANGGGAIRVASGGMYKCASSVDVGTKPFLLIGDGAHRTSANVFGNSFWTTPGAILGSVISFTNPADHGFTVNTASLIGKIQDLGIIGPGSGTTAGIFMGTGGATHVDLVHVVACNFYNGVDIGNAESITLDKLDVAGCHNGLNSSNEATNINAYNIVAQYNVTGINMAAVAMFCLYGGLLQTNSGTGLSVAGASRQVNISGVWFEGNGPTTDAGPDVTFDYSAASVTNVCFNHCHLFADAIPIAYIVGAGTNFVENIYWNECQFGFAFAENGRAVAWNYIGCTGTAGITSPNGSNFIGGDRLAAGGGIDVYGARLGPSGLILTESMIAIINGTNADLVPLSGNVKLTGGGASAIVYGFNAGAYDGQQILLTNYTGSPVTLANESATETTAARRIHSLVSTNHSFSASALIQYSFALSRWVVLNAW